MMGKVSFLGDKIKSKFQYNNVVSKAIEPRKLTPKKRKPARRTQTRELINGEKDPFASDNDFSDASSLLSCYEFVDRLCNDVYLC